MGLGFSPSHTCFNQGEEMRAGVAGGRAGSDGPWLGGGG